MVRRNSKNREDQQRLSGETVNWLPDDVWDSYSGLPNPSWYEKEEDELG